MRTVDSAVARKLNEVHKKQAERINQDRKEAEPFKVGDKVWYRRPEGSGDKLDSRWIGPALITLREGARSYTIEIKPGHNMKVQRSFLKPWIEDTVTGAPTPLHFHKRTVPDVEAGPEEWIVEKVLKHRTKGGKLEFLTKWEGAEEGEETWEPVGNFIHRYSSEFVKYCQEKGLELNLTKHLSAEPLVL